MKVAGLNRQMISDWFDQATAQKPRHTVVGARHVMAKVHRIAGEDFVAPVPAQRYSYVFTRES